METPDTFDHGGFGVVRLGFPWNKDMVDQPAEKPQKSVAPPPPGSIPVDGGETCPSRDGRGNFQDEGRGGGDRESRACDRRVGGAGQALYEINCVVCHGEEGRGDGPVGRKFDPAPVDLNKDYTQSQADGQLFFTLTRGRVAMPFYRDALSPAERWDVINYVKSEFGDK